MLLACFRRPALLIFALALISGRLAEPVHAEGAGHGNIEFGLSFYHNGDSGDGNPFLDEELTVIEPVVIFDYNVSDRSTIWGTISADYVSSASIDRLNKFPDQSGASGDYYVGADIGYQYKWTDTLRIGGFVGASTEYDYNSFAFGADVAKDLDNMNRTYKLSINGFVDTIDIIRFDGTETEGSDTRTSIATTFNWYQVINRSLHGELGTTISFQEGFLETPYNAVVIEDGSPPNPNLDNMAAGREVTEELPDSRTRVAVFGKLRKYLPSDRAIELGGRLYADDWGITSVTLEPRYFFWLVPDDLRLRLRYRFYIQTAADDYDDHFTTETEFRTQDADLADYSAHTFGTRLDWYRTEDSSYGLGLDYVVRTDGINQFLGTINYSHSF